MEPIRVQSINDKTVSSKVSNQKKTRQVIGEEVAVVVFFGQAVIPSDERQEGFQRSFGGRLIKVKI